MKAALLFLAFASGADAPPSSFDLICRGDERKISLGSDDTKPYEARYRIDLAKRRWCEGACERILPIEQVDEFVITISRTDQKDQLGLSLSSIHRFDRHTGKDFYASTMQWRSDVRTVSTVDRRGECSKAGFSGFPPVVHRF